MLFSENSRCSAIIVNDHGAVAAQKLHPVGPVSSDSACREEVCRCSTTAPSANGDQRPGHVARFASGVAKIPDWLPRHH